MHPTTDHQPTHNPKLINGPLRDPSTATYDLVSMTHLLYRHMASEAVQGALQVQVDYHEQLHEYFHAMQFNPLPEIWNLYIELRIDRKPKFLWGIHNCLNLSARPDIILSEKKYKKHTNLQLDKYHYNFEQYFSKRKSRKTLPSAYIDLMIKHEARLPHLRRTAEILYNEISYLKKYVLTPQQKQILKKAIDDDVIFTQK